MPLIVTQFRNNQPGKIDLVSYDGEITDLILPGGVSMAAERPSFAQIKRGPKATLLIAGGASDNLIVTDGWQVLRQYISPMIETLVESAAPTNGQIGLEQIAGTGPTGLCIFYLRWLDTRNKRRSSFSDASPTLSLTGTESVKFHNVPLGPNIPDLAVDKVEVWVARNGAARRRLSTRDVGVSTFTVTESIEYEAEPIDNLKRAPRCRYNAIYHDRYWQSGDPLNADRVYFSPPERYSEFAGGYLSTRNGEAVVGMVKIRDVLVVLCARSSYYISGYSEGDFEMKVLEPSIGGINHHGIQMVGSNAIIPSATGLYACSGTSMRFISGDYTALWTEMYSRHPERFELGFGINDEVGKVYKFYEEEVTVSASGVPTFGVGRYWVLDYAGSILEHGQGDPHLSFDVHAARPKCAVMMAPPGGKIADCFTAFTGVFVSEDEDLINPIVIDDEGELLDVVGDFTTVIQPAMRGYEPEGGPHDGINAIEGWILVHYQSIGSWLLEMLHGPDRAAVRSIYSWALNVIFGIPKAAPPASGGGREIVPGWGSWSAADLTNFSPAALPFKIGLTGEGFCPRLTVLNPKGLVWSGWGFTSEAGKAYLAKHE